MTRRTNREPSVVQDGADGADEAGDARDENLDDEERYRDFNAELETFVREQHLEITSEEMLHVSLLPEQASDLRRHAHVVIRSPRTTKDVALVMTYAAWNDTPLLPGNVAYWVAHEASAVEQAGDSFLAWCGATGADFDSRGAEHQFKQVRQLVAQFKRLLTRAAYDELLSLQSDYQLALQASDDEQPSDDEDETA